MHKMSETGTRPAALESDLVTDLYYYRARYYDPAAGRFLSEDPTTFEGGINFYDYVWNNASNLVDESGLDGHTRGPFTWYTNQEGMSQAQINAERLTRSNIDVTSGMETPSPSRVNFLNREALQRKYPSCSNKFSNYSSKKH